MVTIMLKIGHNNGHKNVDLLRAKNGHNFRAHLVAKTCECCRGFLRQFPRQFLLVTFRDQKKLAQKLAQKSRH